VIDEVPLAKRTFFFTPCANAELKANTQIKTAAVARRVIDAGLGVLSMRRFLPRPTLLLMSKDVGRQFSDRAFREHPGRHLEFDSMNAIGLDYHINRVVPARGHEQIPEENPDVVHSSRQLKRVGAPGSPMGHSINYDCRSTEIEKK
jgi:hypothetical protein